MSQLEKGETAAIWSCREDVVAVIIGQATMVRPLFTRRFWSNDLYSSSSGYSSNKRSDGVESHELSGKARNDSKGSRLGFRTPKDPYNVSVLQTQTNESEERIMQAGQNSHPARISESLRSDKGEHTTRNGIVIETEVDVTREKGKQEFQDSWKVV
jgi:hypothetical protein